MNNAQLSLVIGMMTFVLIAFAIKLYVGILAFVFMVALLKWLYKQ